MGESNYRVRKPEIQSTTWCVERIIDSEKDELMAIANFLWAQNSVGPSHLLGFSCYTQQVLWQGR